MRKDCMVARLARIGSAGLHTSNCERDLHAILKSLGGMTIETELVQARVWDPKTEDVVHGRIPVIMPDKLAAAVWEQGRDMFKYFFTGGVDLVEYWTHVHSTSPWFRAHPAASEPFHKLVPIAIYGDGVQTYRNSEVGNLDVLAWCSDLCYKHSPFARYFLIAAWSEHLNTDFTHDDVMGAVAERICAMVTQQGYPWSDHYKFMFSSVQGDLKWLVEKHRVHPFRSNLFCSWCQCCKEHADVSMTVGDMRESARHRGTLISHEDFLQSTPAHLRFSLA